MWTPTQTRTPPRTPTPTLTPGYRNSSSALKCRCATNEHFGENTDKLNVLFRIFWSYKPFFDAPIFLCVYPTVLKLQTHIFCSVFIPLCRFPIFQKGVPNFICFPVFSSPLYFGFLFYSLLYPPSERTMKIYYVYFIILFLSNSKS